MPDFSDIVRDDIWKILTTKYNTTRHGGHPTDVDEFRRERPFWPDMRFHDVQTVDAPAGRQIRITFTPSTEPEIRYGYRIDVEETAKAWSKRVGIRDPRASPAMFAAELIWYMVAYIGSTRIEEYPFSEDGIRWINTGADVFSPLPEPMAML